MASRREGMQGVNRPLSIAIFQRDLHLGGVQKSLINLLGTIDRARYSIDLFLVDDENFFEKAIPNDVNVIKINSLPSYTKLLPFSIVRRLFRSRLGLTGKSYDVAVDFDGYQHLTAIGALEVEAKIRISWFHGNHRARLKTDPRYFIAWYLQKAKYKFFHRAAVVSEGLKPLVGQDTPFGSDDIFVINNYVDTDEIVHLSGEPVDMLFDSSVYKLISVCRLAPEKGVDRTIDMFANVLRVRDDIGLCIVGGGKEEARLKKQVGRLGIESKVAFVGAQSNPYAYMAQADGYISTPRSEGQGISTVEATCLGLDIFIPKKLEAFTGVNVKGVDDLEEAIMSARRQSKKVNRLHDYNQRVVSSFSDIMEI